MRVRRSVWIDSVLLVVVNLLWAAQYPAYKIASDHMEPGALNFWTFVFAIALLLPVMAFRRREHAARKKRLSARDMWDFVLMGVLGIVPPSVMLAWGIAHSSASNAAILSLTIPLMMTLLGAALLGERLTKLRSLSLVLGLLGTLFVSINDLRSLSFSRELLAGNIVVVIAGAGSAFYNAYGKRLLRTFSELEVLLYSYVSGGAACGLISLFFESKPLYRIGGFPPATWGAVAVLGFLSWGFAMVLWMWVLNRLDVGQISVSVYLLPFLGLLVSVVTLHDHLHAVQLIGGLVVLLATVALTAYDKPQIHEEDAVAALK
jgi:drug/metabolite transporter (DMT)-like permease